MNDKVILKAKKKYERGEFGTKWFRELCGKIHKLQTVPSSLVFATLVGNCSKSIKRSDEDHIRLESEAHPIEASCRITAANSEDLVYFIKHGLELPFGERAGTEIYQNTVDAIDELESSYPPPQPKNDSRHRRWEVAKATYNTLGVYHFAFWKQKGHLHTPPTVSRDCYSGGTAGEGNSFFSSHPRSFFLNY